MIVGSKNLIVLHPDELEWQDDTELFTLPEGVQIKVRSTGTARSTAGTSQMRRAGIQPIRVA